MTLAELYGLTLHEGASADRARALLRQSHWFSVNAEFDPKTGEALPQALSTFLAKVAHPNQNGTIQDRLHRITEHARPSVERLLRSLNESPRRQQALLPVHAVRELDANSFIKLSNRPGRNIREKLAGKPYLQAVRRYQSVNLPENRLFKAFLVRLGELLELRRDLLGEAEDDLIPRIQSWLRGDEALAISRWENLPPNNTLLAHRDYRRVWGAWRQMQTLDDDIARDFSRLDERQETMTRWIDFGRMYREGAHLFAEMPVMFDYEAFSTQAWLSESLVQRAARKTTRSSSRRTFTEPACVDLSEMRPRFAVTEKSSQTLTDAYLWQQWRSASEIVDVPLFESDAACLHPDAFTIASPELFFGADKTSDHWDRAARAFANRLSETFKNDRLIWLVPDALNDFELAVIRRNLNARFPGAEPLPRSVAAVFEQVDYTDITKDGYTVLVVDTIGGTTCATKLIARFKANLKKLLPETKGFYWERCPPVIISDRDTEEERLCGIVTVDVNGNWRKSATPARRPFPDVSHLKADPRVENFALCINLSDGPVAGGIRLHAMQASAGDIPLWRDKIPELSIKAYVNGFYRRFYLVDKNTPPVRPVRGKAVRLDIDAQFPLPLGKKHYSNPLYRGAGAEEIGFSLRLDSPEFPLKSNSKCELILTFHYGDDEPYDLVFVPLDKSFITPVRATWKRKPASDEIVTNAPTLGYPTPLAWADLRRMPKPDSVETRDLLEWVVSAIDRLDRDLSTLRRTRIVGTLTTDWSVDRNGFHSALAECDQSSKVVIHQRNCVRDFNFSSFQKAGRLSFELQEKKGEFFGLEVATANYNPVLALIKRIRKGLYLPVIQIWRDGRSIMDAECLKPFANNAGIRIAYLSELARQNELPASVKHEILFLLSCLHKDTTDECIRWVTDQVEGGHIRDPRAIGFALGDVSQEWQQDIFHRLVSHPNNDAISVFCYAIWRERNFVERFSLSELKALLKVLLKRLNNICSVQASDLNNSSTKWDWKRATTESLELLLGLLRTRASDDPAIRILFQPHQKITKHFAEQIDRVEEIVAESNISLFSRLQIDVQKPEGVRTPDLLYALRLYLTGDDGANVIHITGISDSDDD